MVWSGVPKGKGGGGGLWRVYLMDCIEDSLPSALQRRPCLFLLQVQEHAAGRLVGGEQEALGCTALCSLSLTQASQLLHVCVCGSLPQDQPPLSRTVTCPRDDVQLAWQTVGTKHEIVLLSCRPKGRRLERKWGGGSYLCNNNFPFFFFLVARCLLAFVEQCDGVLSEWCHRLLESCGGGGGGGERNVVAFFICFTLRPWPESACQESTPSNVRASPS